MVQYDQIDEVDMLSTMSLKGTAPQNIFSLKSGHIGCIDLWNDSGLQNNLKKKSKF